MSFFFLNVMNHVI